MFDSQYLLVLGCNQWLGDVVLYPLILAGRMSTCWWVVTGRQVSCRVVDIDYLWFFGNCAEVSTCTSWFFAQLSWGWLSGWSIGYWNGVVMVLVLQMYRFGCRCGSMTLVYVLCICMGVNTALVWQLVGCCMFVSLFVLVVSGLCMCLMFMIGGVLLLWLYVFGRYCLVPLWSLAVILLVC